METKKKSAKTLRKSGKSQGKIREFDRVKKWEPCMKDSSLSLTVADPGFPSRGQQIKRELSTYYFAIFLPKTA